MNTRSLFLTGALLLAFTSCDDFFLDDCMKSTGSMETEERSAGTFNTLSVSDNVDVKIIPSSRYHISVTAGENLLEKIITMQEGSTLYIRNENKCNWVRSFKNRITIAVEVISLDRITYNGTGNITCTDSISSDLFYFENFSGAGSIQLMLNCKESWIVSHTGPADVTASGWTGVSYVYLGGNGFINCSMLGTGYSFVSSKGTNDMRVNVEKELGATIEANGNIYYSGNPYKVTSEITGEGKLIRE